jgi:hypothetical protein
MVIEGRSVVAVPLCVWLEVVCCVVKLCVCDELPLVEPALLFAGAPMGKTSVKLVSCVPPLTTNHLASLVDRSVWVELRIKITVLYGGRFESAATEGELLESVIEEVGITASALPETPWTALPLPVALFAETMPLIATVW